MHSLKLALIWAASAAVVGLCLWIPLGAAAGLIVRYEAWPGSELLLLAFFVYCAMAPFVAIPILSVAVPVYTAVFYLWSIVCRRRPTADSRLSIVSAFTAVIALPPALTIAIVGAWWPGGFIWFEFVVLLPFYFTIMWGATGLPRAVVSSLRPGAFSENLELERASYHASGKAGQAHS